MHFLCVNPTGGVAYSNSYFGQGFSGIFLSNVACTGSEISLLDCSHPGIGVHTCHHLDDAGVSCSRKFFFFSLPKIEI